ncbi:sensor histidine kinase [Paenibacillus sp. ALJ109b]|uniref:cache domain-containing sensor histidine kinase n=1 Tax=Paenibacillus sp. ALJ109b TaxID=2709068 RepID=UPI0013D302DC|nr:sensor histidine kinase [Paenibacillus sp. ALJ109b]NEU64206.1 sensor histidine kinase [Paenibacillus sp. ALJ109b]
MSFIRLLNDIRIRKKLSLMFITVAVLPLLASGVYLTSKLREVMIMNAFEQATDNVERVRKRTEELIKVPLDISYQLSNDSRMKSVASRNYDSYIEVIQTYRQYSDIRDYMRLYKGIKSIRLYTPNPTMLNNWEFMQPDSQTMQAEWYTTALSKKGLAGWAYMQDERDLKYYLSLVRKISLDEPKKESVLVINVNSDVLNSILAQESFSTMIVDYHNNIVAANRPNLYGRNLDEVNVGNNMLTQTEGSFDEIMDGNASKVVITSLIPESSWNGLRVISVFTVSDIIRDANEVIRVASLVVVGCLIIAILLVYASASLITSRVLRLSKHMSRVGTTSWDTYLDIDGKDEIGQLSRQFNSLVVRINQLMLEVEDSNQQKQLLQQKQNEIKFKMLASQVNPHFLFNTLESIRMEAHLRGEEDLAQAVWQLSILMRKSLEVGSGKIRLSEELHMVSCYLELHRFRYEDRLLYNMEVAPGTEEVEIPPLIIQPLVENSILHGLDRKEGATWITIRTKFTEDREVMVEIQDSGAGISPLKLKELQRQLMEAEEGGMRIGLRNVNDRLQLTYGPSSALSIKSIEGQGTEITFCIPKKGEPQCFQ